MQSIMTVDRSAIDIPTSGPQRRKALLNRAILTGRTARVYVALTERDNALLAAYGLPLARCRGELAYRAVQRELTRLAQQYPDVAATFEADERARLAARS